MLEKKIRWGEGLEQKKSKLFVSDEIIFIFLFYATIYKKLHYKFLRLFTDQRLLSLLVLNIDYLPSDNQFSFNNRLIHGCNIGRE